MTTLTDDAASFYYELSLGKVVTQNLVGFLTPFKKNTFFQRDKISIEKKKTRKIFHHSIWEGVWDEQR